MLTDVILTNKPVSKNGLFSFMVHEEINLNGNVKDVVYYINVPQYKIGFKKSGKNYTLTYDEDTFDEQRSRMENLGIKVTIYPSFIN